MRTLSYTVPEHWQGAAVSGFVRGFLGLSSAALKDFKYEGGILVNGTARHANARLNAGDVLSLVLPLETVDYPPEPLALPVIYEDEDFLLAVKPPGMPVHPSPGHDRDSLLNAVSWHYRQTGQHCRIRPLYRLDRDTSGLVLLGKNRIAAGAQLNKRYLAVCQGVLSGSGVIDLPIGLEEGSKIKRACGKGQPAATHWTALAGDGTHTLLLLRLETGRTHQIRVHMSALGHPLAGDDLYGGSRERLGRQALHCCALSVHCPALGVERSFASSPPSDLLRAFPALFKEIKEEAFLCQLV